MADGEGWAHKVTPENLDDFAPILREAGEGRPAADDAVEAETEGENDDDEGDGSNGGSSGIPEEYLDGETFSVGSGRAPAGRGDETDEDDAPSAEPGEVTERGPELWVRPSIPEGDAQRPESDNTQLHGQIRLPQAGYEVDGDRINNQRYFRYDAFGDLEWEEEGGKEIAEAEFEVEIFGTYYGTHTLEVVHDPAWEAEQRNITTVIRWGPLNRLVREEVDVRGARLTIYGPPLGQDEPYHLVIE